MEDIEIKVKNEIKKVINSVEYLKECLITYITYNKGLSEGQKKSILMLAKQVEENKQQIGYLQGNNSKYGVDIIQLQENIKQQIKNETSGIIENNFIRNILKLNNERICETIDKNFYNYLFKNQNNSGVEYEK